MLQSPLSQLPENLNNFIADNSPFRYQLVELNANVNYLLFGQVNNDQVLAGKDGWLFYKDGPDAARPVANYQGLPDTFYSEAELAAAAASLDRLSAALAQHGCTLVLDLTPSKDRVYQEYMPDGYPIVRTENRTDRLAAYLQQHTSARVSWQYPALRARALADPDQPLYFRTDTHWNSAGALIGLDGALTAAGVQCPDFSDYCIVQNGTQTGTWPMWRRCTRFCPPTRSTPPKTMPNSARRMPARWGFWGTASASIIWIIWLCALPAAGGIPTRMP